MSLMHLAVELLAATPTPSPTGAAGAVSKAVAPAEAAKLTIGKTAEWFGPTLVYVFAWVLDATAFGTHSIRDRIAASAVYAASLAMIAIYGWSDDIQGWFGGSYSWHLAGSGIAFLAHVAFVWVLLGEYWEKSKKQAKWLAGKYGIDGEMSKQNRINTKLWWCAGLTAMTSVLARGDAGKLVHMIANLLTGIWAGLAEWGVQRLGG